MSQIAHSTESAYQLSVSTGTALENSEFTTPAEPTFPSICGERSSTADALGGEAALGLSVLGTSPTSDPFANFARSHNRIKCMRRGVFFTARSVEESIRETGLRVRKAFITLTYRPGVEWRSEHISQMLACYAEWARRRGFQLLYAWVMELTQRGIPHYHVVMWLPLGFTPPLPDKQGWWKHGMSQAKWVRSPIGYLAKYLTKGAPLCAFPKNSRIWGSGGLSARQRLCRAWYRAPAWLKHFAPVGEVCKTRRCDGGWWNMTTGFWYRSPWEVKGFTEFGPLLRWVGWRPDDIELRGAA